MFGMASGSRQSRGPGLDENGNGGLGRDGAGDSSSIKRKKQQRTTRDAPDEPTGTDHRRKGKSRDAPNGSKKQAPVRGDNTSHAARIPSTQAKNGRKRNGKLDGNNPDAEYRPSPSLSSSPGSERTYEFAEADHPSAATPYAKQIYDQLSKDGIRAPAWPADASNPSNKAALARFKDQYKAYRDRARASLIKAGLIDDPDDRKRLEDAIDFSGICEDMCPDFEKITRITEFDVRMAERDPDSGLPLLPLFVKKLARSAAGQEAPLPMDVRSVASLRRTIDYLIDDLIVSDADLPLLHGFLWDRTRAIRRDFAFYSVMTPEEMVDQVYCLERIARFHVTSLHLLSQKHNAPDDYSEHQEVEQLGNTLMSLKYAYDDCRAQGVVCPNEPEFRAYELLLKANQPNILETVQHEWDPAFWTESDDVRTAVSLVEALHSTHRFHGPLSPGPSVASDNNHHAYLRVLEDPAVSYTLACFAEIHFGQLRRSMLESLKKGFARPRDPPRDVAAAAINDYLGFDTVEEAIEFAEKLGLRFRPDPAHPTSPDLRCLSLDGSSKISHSKLAHQFSFRFVESKRRGRPISDVTKHTFSSSATAAEEGATPSVPRVVPNGINPAAQVSTAAPTIDPFNPDSLLRRSPFGAFSQGQNAFPAGNPFTFGTKLLESVPAPGPAAPATLSRPNPFSSASDTAKFGSTTTPAADPVANPFAAAANPATTAAATIPGPFASAVPSQSSARPPAPTFGAPASMPFTAAPTFGVLAPMQSTAAPTFGVLATTQSAAAPTFSVLAPSQSTTVPTFGTPATSRSPAASAAQTFAMPASPRSTLAAEPAPVPLPAPFSSFIQESSVKEADKMNRFASFGPVTASTPPTNEPAAINNPSPRGMGLLGRMPAPSSPGFHFCQSANQTQPGSTHSRGADQTPSIQLTPQTPLTPSERTASAAKSMPRIPTPVAATQPARATPPATPAFSNEEFFDKFSSWFVMGDGGLLEEFEKFVVGEIAGDVFAQFTQEEEERKVREEKERADKLARDFRHVTLKRRYLQLWRGIARKKSLTRIRTEGREKMRAYHEAQRAARAERARAVQAAEKETAKHKPSDELYEIIQRSSLRKSITRPTADDPGNAFGVAAAAAAAGSPTNTASSLDSSPTRKRAASDLYACGVLAGVSDVRAAVSRIVQSEETSMAGSVAGDMEPPRRPAKKKVANDDEETDMRQLGKLGIGLKTARLMAEYGGSKTRRSLPPLPKRSRFSSGSASTPQRPRRANILSEHWRLQSLGINIKGLTPRKSTNWAEHDDLASLRQRQHGLRRASEASSSSLQRPLSSVAVALSPASVISAAVPRGNRAIFSHMAGTSLSKRKREAEENDDHDAGAAGMDGLDGSSNKKSRSVSPTSAKLRDVDSGTGSGILYEARMSLKEMRDMRMELEEGVSWFREQNDILRVGLSQASSDA